MRNLYQLQRIVFIQQYKIRLLHKAGPQLFLADFQHNHRIGIDEEIPRMGICINMIETFMNIPECMTVEEI